MATVEIPLERLVTITGRVIDAQTGKGVAGIAVACYRVERACTARKVGAGQTDAEGRYSVLAQPGTGADRDPRDCRRLISARCPTNIPTSRSRPTGPCPT